MSDDDIEAHAAVVGALLEANPNLTNYEGGQVPDLAVPPYVVRWVSLDSEEAITLDDQQVKPNVRVTTHSVGSSGPAARAVAGQVRASLLGVRPVIAGRKCWKIKHELGLPPQPDDSTGRTVVDVVDVWTFASVPA